MVTVVPIRLWYLPSDEWRNIDAFCTLSVYTFCVTELGSFFLLFQGKVKLRHLREKGEGGLSYGDEMHQFASFFLLIPLQGNLR